MKNLRQVGSVASFAMALGFLVLVALLFVLVGQGYTPGSGNDPARALAFAASSPLPYVIYSLYAFFALLMPLVVEALAERFAERAPSVTRFARVAITITAALFLGYAMLGLVGEPLLVNAFAHDAPTASAAYLAVRVVMNALNTGAIFASGWAILLIGWASLQAAGWSRALSGLLLLAGLLSILSLVVSPLSLVAPLLYIVWGFWVGIRLWRAPMSNLLVTRAAAS